MFIENALLPRRSPNGVWWMLRGRVRIYRLGRVIVGSIGVRGERPCYLDGRRARLEGRTLTFRIGTRQK